MPKNDKKKIGKVNKLYPLKKLERQKPPTKNEPQSDATRARARAKYEKYEAAVQRQARIDAFKKIAESSRESLIDGTVNNRLKYGRRMERDLAKKQIENKAFERRYGHKPSERPKKKK